VFKYRPTSLGCRERLNHSLIGPVFAPVTTLSDSISRLNSDIDSIQLPANLPSQFGDQVFKYTPVLMAIF
jgi:hypothetical protein